MKEPFSCVDFFINLSHYSKIRTCSKALCISTQLTCPVVNEIIKTRLAENNIPILSSSYATRIQQELYKIIIQYYFFSCFVTLIQQKQGGQVQTFTN